MRVTVNSRLWKITRLLKQLVFKYKPFITYYSHKGLLPTIKRSKKFGNLIFIGSEAALRGSRKGTLCNASKFGLRGLLGLFREETSNGNVSVNYN